MPRTAIPHTLRVPVATTALALLALAGALSPGFVLHNDSVAVPSQHLLPWMWGAGQAPARSVPQDAVVAVLDDLIPGAVLQRLLMFGGLVLLGLGVARLLRERTVLEQAVAAATAMWSTYVFERAAMGHWGLLLGVGALPWVLAAAAALRAGRSGALSRLAGWVLIGSLVPTAGALQAGAATAALLWPGRSSRRAVGGAAGEVAGGRRAAAGRVAGGIATALAIQLVWVVPGLVNPGGTTASPSAVGSAVFGLRAEGLAGPLLTALGTGGIWNADAAPARDGLMSAVAPALMVSLAALGVRRLRGLEPAVLGSLALLSAIGLVWALLTYVPVADQLVAWLEALPGGGLLRDAQKWLAPWLVLLSLAVGTGAGWIRERVRGDAGGPVAVALLLLPIVLLPEMAFGMWGRLGPAAYPPGWTHAAAALAASAEPGDVVSLPWSAFRAYDWNDRRTVLDPAPRYMPRTVVTDSRLLVHAPDGLAVVPSDDRRSVAVSAALVSADPDQGLRRLGISWILWQEGQPATPGYPGALPEFARRGTEVVRVPGLRLIHLPGPLRMDATAASASVPAWPWVIWLGCVMWVLARGLARILARILARGRARGHTRGRARGDRRGGPSRTRGLMGLG